MLAATAMADLPDDVVDKARTFSHVTAQVSDLNGGEPPRFAFSPRGAVASPKSFVDARVDFGDLARPIEPITVATSADGKSTWIAEDIEYAPDRDTKGRARVHAIGLFNYTDNVLPYAWHLGEITPPEGKKPSFIELTKLPTKIDAGAEAAAALFSKTIGDPAALAKTVSDRADAAMYGPEAADRFVGGAAIKRQLAAWGLKLSVRDGVQAGVTESNNTAFVAANVDARNGKGVTAYRLMIIYDKVGDTWQLVAMQLSRAIQNS